MIISKNDISEIKPNGFIVIDGVNGAGKGTVIEKLKKYLEEKSTPAFFTREPGAGEFGKTIRELILNPKEKLPEITELFLFASDRSHHVANIMKPEIKKGNLVISDRYYYSTTAFQGYGRKVDLNLINQINSIAIQGFTPDFVLLLDLDPEEGLKRTKKIVDNERDAFEEEELNFHKRIRQGYLDTANELPEKFIIIDASKSAEEVWQEIEGIFDNYLKSIK